MHIGNYITVATVIFLCFQVLGINGTVTSWIKQNRGYSESNFTARKNLTLPLIPIHSPYENVKSVIIRATLIRPVYYVNLSIGTGIFTKEKLLIFDTGSALTWVQCFPCKPCTNKLKDLFNPSLSTTYSPILSSDPLCEEPYIRNQNTGRCSYNISYDEIGKFNTTGQLAKETFVFNDAFLNSPTISFGSQELVFGCSNTAQSPYNFDGILGMGYRDDSFAMQLLKYTFSNSLSYCLSRTGDSYVSFAEDFDLLNGQETPLLERKGRDTKYFLILEDIGINGQRMGFGEETFRRSEDGETGGCFIDTACTYSRMKRDVYAKIEEEIINYFNAMNLLKIPDKKILCFTAYQAVPLPTFTYFLRGAELQVRGDSVFWWNKLQNETCWKMYPNDKDRTVIGTNDQMDTQFVINTKENTLKFGPGC